MKKEKRFARCRDKANIPVLRYSMQCLICGHVVFSSKVGREPAIKEVEEKMGFHIKDCKPYQVVMSTGFKCSTVKTIKKTLAT